MEKITEKDILEMITIIKANYFYAYKDISKTEMQAMARTWFIILGKEPKELVMAGFYKALEHCKMPPTIADIKSEINAIYDATRDSDTELWAKLHNALNYCRARVYKFQFNVILENGKTQGQQAREETKECYNSLPEEIKTYLGSYSEFIALANNNENDEFEKGRFLKIIKSIRERSETLKTISPEVMSIAQQGALLLENKGDENGTSEQ